MSETELQTLFDEQMTTLKARNCPKDIINVLTAKKDDVLKIAGEIEISEGHIPFMPIIPRQKVNLKKIIEMVYSHGNKGNTNILASELTNTINVPEEPYFIFGVNDGADTLDVPSDKAGDFIEKQGRTCLTVDECISLCTHANVLTKHCIHCIGSHFQQQLIPAIHLSDDVPMLSWYHNLNLTYGSPSCLSRAV